jgi:Ser/Thr protein kinase RdoA (MazF antagonist)
MIDSFAKHPLAGLFNKLTPELVLDVVEAGGRRCSGRFLILNSYENRVWQFELEDGTWVVGKFYRPGRWNRDALLAEHRFLRELADEEVPVAAPVELTPGETLGQVEGIWYALFTRIGGRAPQELDDEQVRIVGRLLGRIHNVGARNDAPARMRLTTQTYALDNLQYLLDEEVLPPEARDSYAASVRALVERIAPLFTDVPVHRIHGDCHLGNLIWTPKGPTFLDFDDTLVGPAVQDVWMLVPSADEEGRRQRGLLLEAYNQFREFRTSWLRLVEPLRALRYIHYATWIAKRRHDPIFPRTWAHHGTLQYWQMQIQDIREQIARIDQAGDSA